MSARILVAEGILLLIVAAIHLLIIPVLRDTLVRQLSAPDFQFVWPPFVLAFVVLGILLVALWRLGPASPDPSFHRKFSRLACDIPYCGVTCASNQVVESLCTKGEIYTVRWSIECVYRKRPRCFPSATTPRDGASTVRVIKPPTHLKDTAA
jgi:hypothetical protein